MPSKRATLAQHARTTGVCLLVIALYFLVPVEPGLSGVRKAVQAALVAAGVVVVARFVLQQVTRQLGMRAGRTSLTGLAVALVAGVASFALADYVIALTAPDEFAGLDTKVDALYFVLSTLTTIGYGDIYAAGQVARVVVSIQIIFGIAVIATGASVLLRRASGREPQ
jgi:voltage-gated potassium channel